MDIELAIVNHDALVERLHRHEDDLTIMTLLPGDVDIDAVPFRDNALVCVAPAEHPLAGRRDIPLAALHAERFVLREGCAR